MEVSGNQYGSTYYNMEARGSQWKLSWKSVIVYIDANGSPWKYMEVAIGGGSTYLPGKYQLSCPSKVNTN